ncbi:hypothetical protein SEA_FUNSIZED_32 [Mycobacterium phage Funsized]|nr:hypothetical protein SEA_FUNSIZED_32 [Mycobacterium phage Funsized]
MTGPLRTDFRVNEVYDPEAANATNALVNAMILDLQADVDRMVASPGPVTALNTNVLTGAADYIDVLDAHTAIVQTIGSAGITAGAVVFEGSNDGVTWQAVNRLDLGTAVAAPSGAITIAANAVQSFLVKLTHRYFRLRVSTLFAGGSVQAIARLTPRDISPPGVVVSGTITNIPTTASIYKLTTAASANFAVITSSTSVRRIGSLWAFNPTAATAYVKLYSKTTTPVAGDVPVITVPVPANQLVQLDGGLFGNGGFSGMGIGVTANADAAAATPMAAAGVQIVMAYTT